MAYISCTVQVRGLLDLLMKTLISTLLYMYYSQATFIRGPSAHDNDVTRNTDLKSNVDGQWQECHSNRSTSLSQDSNESLNAVFEQQPRTSISASQTPKWDNTSRVPLVSLFPDDIFDYLRKETEHKFLIQDYSCTGKCGFMQLDRCSCKPSCIALKSCCIDFKEVCVSRVFPLKDVEDNYKLLKDVEVVCNNGNLVIASCPVNRTRNRLHDSISNKTEDTSYLRREGRLNPRDPMELLRLSAQRSSDSIDVPVSSKLEWLLSTAVVEDTSTGLSYINASVFECNGAHWPSAKPWTVGIRYFHDTFLSEDRIVSLESILSLMDLGKAVNIKGTFGDPCLMDAISNCPARYRFSEIEDACKSTALFVRVTDTFSDVKSSRNFKNPFCQACRQDFDLRYRLDLLRVARKGVNDIKFTIKSNEISVHAPYSFASGSPSWSRLSCNLSESRNMKLTKSIDSLIEHGSGTSSTSEVRSNCMIIDCVVDREGEQECYHTISLGLLLPPAARTLTTTELHKISKQFFQVLQNIFSEWQPRILNGSMEIKRDVFDYRSRKVEYAVSFRLATTVVFADLFDLQWEGLPEMLGSGHINFHFQIRNLYFCIVLSRYHHPSFISELYHPYRCWDLPKRFAPTSEQKGEQSPPRDRMKSVSDGILSYPTTGSTKVARLPSPLPFLACLFIASIITQVGCYF